MRNVVPILVGLGLIGCALAVLAMGMLLLSQRTCSVALEGTAAVVEIKGFGADAECRSWIEHYERYPSRHYYDTPEQPTKPVICVIERSGLTFTVRDQGLLNIQGTDLCDWIYRNE